MMSAHIIPITPYALGTTPARCYDHGERDHVGFIVAYSHARGDDVTFEDIAYVDGPTNYSEALRIVKDARNEIHMGRKNATYAVIHHIYEVDGVAHRHG